MSATSDFYSQNQLEHRYQGEHPLRTFVYMYTGERRRMALAAVLFVIKHSPMWAMPLLTANIIDLVARPGPGTPAGLWSNFLALALILFQNIPLHYLYVRQLSLAVRAVETQLRSSLCRRLQHLSLDFYTRQSAGALQSKVLRDVEAIEQLTRLLYDGALSALTNIVFALITTALRAPFFILFYLITVPVAAALVRSLRQTLADRNAAFRREIERMSARVIEMTHLIPVTRAHGLETIELERVDQTLGHVRQAGLELDSVNAVFSALAWVTFNMFNMGSLLVTAWVYYLGWLPLTLGDVVLVTTYFSLLTSSVMALVNMLPQISRGLESIRSIGEVLECPDIEHNAGKLPVSEVRGELLFENVTYRYPGAETPAVEDFSLHVAPGDVVALVGASGAGKSTVLNLVIGFARPTSGRILLDGQDMETLDLRTYRRYLSVVPQETILFEGTIRENVTYGLRSVSDEVVMAALRDANALEFVEHLPDGLETRVGERGARLSGGQKQRLAIARAFIRNPRVLILDEATSALDAESEALIQEALERLMRGRTTFVAAHRLSTIRNARRIVVLEHGRIAEIGTHAELLERNGVYARLYARQEAL